MARVDDSQKEPCKGGCGKRVFNRSGYCQDCRRFICKECGAEDKWNTDYKDVCSKCRGKGGEVFRHHSMGAR